MVCCLLGWPPANQGPTFEEEEDDDDLTGEQADGQGGFFPPEGEEDGEHPAPTLVQKAVYTGLVALNYAAEYTIPVLKYGWLPFVAGVGLTRVYAREDRPAFEGPRFLLGMLVMSVLGIKPEMEMQGQEQAMMQ